MPVRPVHRHVIQGLCGNVKEHAIHRCILVVKLIIKEEGKEAGAKHLIYAGYTQPGHQATKPSLSEAGIYAP